MVGEIACTLHKSRLTCQAALDITVFFATTSVQWENNNPVVVRQTFDQNKKHAYSVFATY